MTVQAFRGVIALLAAAQLMICAEVPASDLAGSEAQGMPNVILITISSLRADHVGCMGYHRDTTPNLDAFGKRSCLFKNAFATSSWMMPAHGSIFTSLYPSSHGATHIDKKLSLEPDTRFGVDHGDAWHGLGEGGVDGLSFSQAGLEGVVDDLLGAFFAADAAAGALVFIAEAGAYGSLASFSCLLTSR